MKENAKLIYKSYMTYFPTILPVYYYGMPNGKIYCMFARYCESKSYSSELEFIFAEHEDFTFNYKSEEIQILGEKEISTQRFKYLVDLPDQRIKIFLIKNGLHSYAEAQVFLNEKLLTTGKKLYFEWV